MSKKEKQTNKQKCVKLVSEFGVIELLQYR